MRIEVHGIPAPQGSKRHVGGGRMVEQSRAVGPWREAVRAETQRAASCARRQTPAGGFITDEPFRSGLLGLPMAVEIEFRLPRPKTAPKKIELPAKRPDLDKLTRAVLDGLTAGGAFLDDGQVVTLYSRKIFATDEEPAGCVIWLLTEKETR